ncbi:MAG: sporulation initiation factor Spo0A C-terminal domain-containing protein [Clostridia bacterium]|nr:sporulation initiation factor Spo0A C-terminal domain-containing protein [Clostridia bacterium]
MPDGRTRILLVDDNVDFTRVTAEYLGIQPDMEVVGIAHDGVEGLEMAARISPDLILLDLIMPHLDGIGVIEHLRHASIPNRPCVIVLTAVGQEAVVSRMIAAGADYYIMKPFDFGVLTDRIRRFTSVPPDSARPEIYVTSLLHEMGIPAHLLGHAYLRDAILMALDEGQVSGNVTRVIYPTIAASRGATPSRVERAMRHAIEIAWSRGDIDTLNGIFGHTVDAEKGRPTNSAFIARVADKIRLDMLARS